MMKKIYEDEHRIKYSDGDQVREVRKPSGVSMTSILNPDACIMCGGLPSKKSHGLSRCSTCEIKDYAYMSGLINHV